MSMRTIRGCLRRVRKDLILAAETAGDNAELNGEILELDDFWLALMKQVVEPRMAEYHGESPDRQAVLARLKRANK